jgi:hypothetical protein
MGGGGVKGLAAFERSYIRTPAFAGGRGVGREMVHTQSIDKCTRMCSTRYTIDNNTVSISANFGLKPQKIQILSNLRIHDRRAKKYLRYYPFKQRSKHFYESSLCCTLYRSVRDTRREFSCTLISVPGKIFGQFSKIPIQNIIMSLWNIEKQRIFLNFFVEPQCPHILKN